MLSNIILSIKICFKSAPLYQSFAAAKSLQSFNLYLKIICAITKASCHLCSSSGIPLAQSSSLHPELLSEKIFDQLSFQYILLCFLAYIKVPLCITETFYKSTSRWLFHFYLPPGSPLTLYITAPKQYFSYTKSKSTCA